MNDISILCRQIVLVVFPELFTEASLPKLGNNFHEVLKPEGIVIPSLSAKVKGSGLANFCNKRHGFVDLLVSGPPIQRGLSLVSQCYLILAGMLVEVKVLLLNGLTIQGVERS